VRLIQALNAAARRLAAVSDTPRLDAELLMAHALGETREEMLLAAQNRAVPAAFDALLARRMAHEPLAYITGFRDFWTIRLAVTPAVLIPRPDSETLIEAAVAHFGATGPARVLDLGTGSGALLLAAVAEWPAAIGLGIDRSPAALAVAADNAERLGLADRARFAPSGWEAGADGGYDLVLCNPPYVETGAELPRDVAQHEPHSALFAGADGLDDYRAIAPLLRLPPHGIACVEIGAAQGAAVSALFRAAGFLTQIRPDLSGRDRCLIATPRG
jgi:release factor glutamine methyltransferase